MITSPDGARLNQLQSLTETEAFTLQLGDQLAGSGLLLPMFGVRPSVRIADGVDVSAGLGARRMPLEPLPRWGDPMLATAGLDLRKGALTASGSGGVSAAGGVTAPTGSARVGYAGSAAGFTAGGGLLGETLQGNANAYLRTDKLNLSIGGVHFGAGDPILSPARDTSITQGMANLRITPTRALAFGGMTNLVRQSPAGDDPRTQLLAGAFAQLRATRSTSMTANLQRIFPSAVQDGRWNGSGGLSTRTKAITANSFFALGGATQADLLMWRTQARVGGRGPLQADGLVNVIGRRNPDDSWKTTTQLGLAATGSTRKLMVGGRLFAFVSETRPSFFGSGIVGAQVRQNLRLTGQLLTNGRENTTAMLGVSLRGRPIVEIGGFAPGLSGRVEGVAFEDLNRNGERDDGEPGLPGLQVSLDGKRFKVTDDDGAYRFNGVAQRAHELRIDKDGWAASGPTDAAVRLDPLRTEVVDFALKGGTFFGGSVYFDQNLNDQRDPGEPSAEGIQVALFDAAGTKLAERTVKDGFMFPDLRPGTYTVKIDPLSLPPNVVVPGGLEREGTVTAHSVMRLDIPVRAVRTVTGRVFVDTNANGRWDDKIDEPVSGFKVLLRNGSPTVSRELSTDAQGRYTFKGIEHPGQYTVYLADGQSLGPYRLENGTSRVVADFALDAPPMGEIARLLPPPMPVRLKVGQPVEVDVRAELADGSVASIADRLTWRFPPSSVADADGHRLVGLREGRDLVTAVVGTHDLQVEVLVEMPEIRSITAEPGRLQLAAGDTAPVRARLLDVAGRLIPAPTDVR